MCLAGRLSEGSLGLFDQGAKCFRLADGDVGHDLAVNFDTGFGQAVDELGIVHFVVVDSHSGINALDPERAELPLFDLTTDISVLTGFPDGLVRDAERILAAVTETLCLLQNFLVATVCDNTSFYT